MLPHKVTKGKVLPQFVNTLFTHIEVMFGETGSGLCIHKIEGLPLRHAEISLMDIAKSFQSLLDLGKRSSSDDDVDVYDRLRHHARDGGAADMLDRAVDTDHAAFQKRLDFLEVRRPRRIVRLDKSLYRFFICPERYARQRPRLACVR